MNVPVSRTEHPVETGVQTRAEQIWSAAQIRHEPPPEPQASSADPARHAVPSQHPEGHAAGSGHAGLTRPSTGGTPESGATGQMQGPNSPSAPHSAPDRAPPELDEVVQRVAANVRRLREAKGLTQEDVAEAVGIGARHLQRLEAGGGPPSLKLLTQLGRVLGEDVREFFVPGLKSNPRSPGRPRKGSGPVG
jgi:DNA-binding XRE family transcriptional regulator